MKLEQKVFNKALQKLRKDLYSGRKNFKELKEICYRMLKNTSELWQEQLKPISAEDFEKRKFIFDHTELALSMYESIKEANKYRAAHKFRNCRYRKFFDEREKKIMFECSFFKIVTRENKINYFIMYVHNKRGNGWKAQLIKGPAEIDLPIIEEGTFRNSPVFFDEFNIFFYPRKGKSYGYNFKGKTNDNMIATNIHKN